MARDDDDRDTGRRKNNKPQRQQSRAGDVTVDDSFLTRFLFRLLTDLVSDLGEKSVTIPILKSGLDALIAAMGKTGVSLTVNAVGAALQNPEWLGKAMALVGAPTGAQHYVAEVIDEAFDGLRLAIRTERVDGQEVQRINQNDANLAIAKAIENKQEKKPPPVKTYAEAFLALSPEERSTWDAILRRFTPEQSAEFARFRNSLTNPEIFRAALCNTVDRLGEVEPPAALLQFFGRHFDVPKPPAATKVAAFAGELAKNAKNALEKTFRVLPEEQRNATHTARMQALQALSDEMDQD